MFCFFVCLFSGVLFIFIFGGVLVFFYLFLFKCAGAVPAAAWDLPEDFAMLSVMEVVLSCLMKGCFSLEGHLLDHIAMFYFSQAVTPPAHVADVLHGTFHGLFLCSQDKSGAKDRVLKVSAVSGSQVLARVVPTACRC